MKCKLAAIVACGLMSIVASVRSLGQPTQPTDGVRRDHGGIVRGPTTQKRLSIIFTGGEYAEGVPEILRSCRKRSVPASFFVTGDFLRLHPDAARMIVAAGHVLGPHGDAHLLYCAWDDRSKTLVTREEFEADLRKNLDDLRALGVPPTRYFVPPFEWYNADQVTWSRAMGLTLMNFTSGSGSNRDYIPEGDPKFTPSIDLVRGVLDYEERTPNGLRGFILLLHAGSKRQDKMHDHLDGLLAEIQERGYQFVTLNELLGSSE